MGSRAFSPIIADGEYLYRGITNKQWDFVNNRITSAAYKDSLGVSVDRSGDRDEESCVSHLLQNKPFIAIGRLMAGFVRESGLLVKYDPTEENEYHSEIRHSENRAELTTGQSKKMSRSATVVYLQEDLR